eukprot:TRINITY_DN28575_c0_g1_i1.p1 TRINITY_DN28575_c0_g1~~TRINITY_DN28575_c0_g1_i1.p1  ORF type:complete len:102 (+),score=8.21 TRINITY_DN28575_c0_g1_i1:200-505(+)
MSPSTTIALFVSISLSSRRRQFVGFSPDPPQHLRHIPPACNFQPPTIPPATATSQPEATASPSRNSHVLSATKLFLYDSDSHTFSSGTIMWMKKQSQMWLL